METLLHNLSEVLAVSIIHSLWQCLIIYLLLRIVLGSAIRFSAAAKYNIGVIALYYVTLWFVYTLFDQAKHYTWVITNNTAFTAQPHLPLITTLKHLARANDRYELTIEHYLPYITIAYVLGIMFNSLKLTSSWMQLRQLKQSTVASMQLQEKVNRLSAKLKLKKQVVIGYAEKIDIPCVAGYLKPLIMLPLSISTYLSAKEIEAILLHELAHVKRNDYLVNLLQQIMSVIFFFNPFVHLISRMVNHERENSCDDLVLEITEEPLIYAQALLKIQQNNLIEMPFALAATGKKYHLLNRIERIMKTKNPTTNLRHLALAFTILLASTVSLAWLNPAIGNGKLSIKALKPATIFNNVVDTTRTTRKVEVRTYAGADHKPITGKKVWVNKDGNRYAYHSGPVDPKLEAMGKEMEVYGKQMEAYYNNAPYKKLQEDMEKSGKSMEEYYNNPKLKKMQAEMEATGKEFEGAYGDNSQAEKIGKEMEARGKTMENYYNSSEFKKLNTELEKKYNIPENHNYRDDRDEKYRQYEAELKQHTPAEVLAAQSDMKKLGDEMRSHFNTPERKAMQQKMREMGDSMRIAFNNPRIKAQQEAMHKYGDQMRAYSQSPEIKELQRKIKLKGEEMKAYTNSPEFKKKVAEWNKNMKWDFNNDDASVNINQPAPPPVPEVNAPEPPAKL